MGAMVTVFAPDGTQGQVPQARVRDAIAAGGQLGLPITAPDGTPGYVPANRFNDALKAGGKAAVAGANGPLPQAAPAPLPSGLQAKAPASDNSIQRSFDEQTASDPQYGAAQNIGKSIVRSIGSPFVHPLSTAKSLLSSMAVDAPTSDHAMDSNPVVSTLRGVMSDYHQGGAGYAAENLGGSLAGQALLGGVMGAGAKALAPESVVPGENFTPTQARAHTGVLARMTGLGDNFIPQQASSDTLSTIRQAAADNPAITKVAMKSGSTPENIAAFQAILQKANSALEAPHASTIAQYAGASADVSPVQAAIRSALPQTLSGVAPEDAAALQEMSDRLGTVTTMGGLNDLRRWLNNEAAAGYKQDGIAANRGTATKAGFRSAADAARSAYFDQLQQLSGTDFQPIKAQQSALMNQQEGAAKLGQTLSAQQGLADEPKSPQQILADALTGGRVIKAGPIAGTAQVVAERVLGRKPLTQPNYLIRKSLEGLPGTATVTTSPAPGTGLAVIPPSTIVPK